MTQNVFLYLVKISYISTDGHVEFSKSRTLPFNNGSVENKDDNGPHKSVDVSIQLATTNIK